MPLDFTIWYAASVAGKMATGECNLWFLKYLWLSEEHFYWKKIVYFVYLSTFCINSTNPMFGHFNRLLQDEMTEKTTNYT